MSLKTNLSGRLRNTALPKANALMPIFEAVVNAIHAIEEIANDSGEIHLEILRSGQQSLNNKQKKSQPIVGFLITDNGCGFNDQNFSIRFRL